MEGANNTFFASKPPENKGKIYNTTPATLKKLEKLHGTYYRHVEKTGEAPTLDQVAQVNKISKNTARKYLKMLDLKTKGQR
ncbi:MAG: hypothetical protein AAFR61_15305 [Bacteroidota bacterium]